MNFHYQNADVKWSAHSGPLSVTRTRTVHPDGHVEFCLSTVYDFFEWPWNLPIGWSVKHLPDHERRFFRSEVVNSLEVGK